jgi:hypothetical protein
VEIRAVARANFTFFNGLMLFAQFQGNRFFLRRQCAARRMILRGAKNGK